MWIFTTGGFISVVDKGAQGGVGSGILTVRSRDRESLELVVSGVELTYGQTGIQIRDNEGTDYQYRIDVKKEDFATYLAWEVENQITYTNFKSAVSKSLGNDWSAALASVWTVMWDLGVKLVRKT